ncbi:MAG: hypothetical protein JWO36_1110 [Myxococcales bacterium]|nr:hypothetical protein [Myxococcales bacterium]
MRAEDKEVDGPELVRAEKKSGDELDKGDDEELPEIAGEETRDIHNADRGVLLGAMRMILEESQLDVETLQLPKRELVALEALQAAVSGRDSELDKFMYATDRSEMLEQALAVLQPNLAQGDANEIAGVFEEMVGRVGDLRRDLKGLEDAQDELLDGSQKDALAKAEGGDTCDKPKPDGDTSLDGPERKAPAKPTSLLGPELKEAPRPASTLAGPEPAAASKPGSTLAGPEPKITKPGSSLGGADLPEPSEAPSTLGDPAELEAQQKKPWWRRPFG